MSYVKEITELNEKVAGLQLQISKINSQLERLAVIVNRIIEVSK